MADTTPLTPEARLAALLHRAQLACLPRVVDGIDRSDSDDRRTHEYDARRLIAAGVTLDAVPCLKADCDIDHRLAPHRHDDSGVVLDAARAAAPDGLDVERLANAMHVLHFGKHPSVSPCGHQREAEIVAREYAALAQSEEATHG